MAAAQALAPVAPPQIILPSGRPVPAGVPALSLRARQRRQAEESVPRLFRRCELRRTATGCGPASAPEERPRPPVAMPGSAQSAGPAHLRAGRRLTVPQSLRWTASRPPASSTPIGEPFPAPYSRHGPRHNMHWPPAARLRRDLARAPEPVAPLPPALVPVRLPPANGPPGQQPVLVPLVPGDRKPVSRAARRLEAHLPEERGERQRSACAPSARPSLAAPAPARAEAKPAQAQGVRPPRPQPSAPSPVSRFGAHVAADRQSHPGQRDEAQPTTALAERRSAAPELRGQIYLGASAKLLAVADAALVRAEQPHYPPHAGPYVISAAVAQAGKVYR